MNQFGDIQTLQTKLKGAGFDPGAIDNQWGPNTEKAVKAFQQSKGLGVDGIAGEKTWGALGGGIAQTSSLSSEQTQYNDRESKINDLVNSLTQQINQPFNYNPESDPQYKAAKQLAEANAKQAGNQAMAELNDRGIFNSSMTGDRLADINNKYITQGMAEQVPALRAAALQERQNQIGNTQNTLKDLEGLNSEYRNEQYRKQQLAAQQDYREQQLSLREMQMNNNLTRQKYDLNQGVEAEINSYLQKGNFYRPVDMLTEMYNKYGDSAEFNAISSLIHNTFDSVKDNNTGEFVNAMEKPLNNWNGGKNRYR